MGHLLHTEKRLARSIEAARRISSFNLTLDAVERTDGYTRAER